MQNSFLKIYFFHLVSTDLLLISIIDEKRLKKKELQYLTYILYHLIWSILFIWNNQTMVTLSSFPKSICKISIRCQKWEKSNFFDIQQWLYMYYIGVLVRHSFRYSVYSFFWYEKKKFELTNRLRKKNNESHFSNDSKKSH